MINRSHPLPLAKQAQAVGNRSRQRVLPAQVSWSQAWLDADAPDEH